MTKRKKAEPSKGGKAHDQREKTLRNRDLNIEKNDKKKGPSRSTQIPPFFRLAAPHSACRPNRYFFSTSIPILTISDRKYVKNFTKYPHNPFHKTKYNYINLLNINHLKPVLAHLLLSYVRP